MQNETETHFLPHWRHVFSSDLAALGLSNKQTDGVILAQNEHEWVADATVFDPRALIIALHIFNDLSLGSICRKLNVSALRSEGLYDLPGSSTRMAFDSTCRMAVPWKNAAAPTVTPCTRVVIVISPLSVRVPNCHISVSRREPCPSKEGGYTYTREAWRRDGVRPED
jgi:hypothetical protein